MYIFRDKLEAAEKRRLGIDKKKDSDEDDVIDGDPFKPLDYEKLKRKVRTRET